MREQDGQVELETKQDDSQTQQFVGDKSRRVLHSGLVLHGGADIPLANRELGDHTDQQSNDQRAEQAESRKLLQPRGDQ